jgi:eukaryotic-like serine/threonine-protein kinase
MTDEGHAPTIPETEAPSGASGPPTIDPRYGLRALLGRGGMGEVWLAHDGRIDREIAIKLMRGGTTDPERVGRFLREARVQGRLEHPSVVPVHDMSTDASTPYFAMKRLMGTTLADVIAAHDSTKWPRRTLLAKFVDICLAVEFAHARGVIHRDLKPANIMLGDYGEAYVLDWGLARITGDAHDSDVIRRSDLPTSGGGGTEAGAMLGTPGYMAPEQMRGDPVDARADIFALGCILFEILVGEPAIPRDRTLEVTLTTDGFHPGGDVPPELDAACARATAAKPADRHPTARALADEVQRFLDGDRDLERRRQLSAEHVVRAREQIATDIGEAMREAGSAIALDPSNRDAQAVLAQLLLEPPKTMPAEARTAIEEDRQRAFRPVLLRTSLIYVVALALLPVAYWLGLRGTGVIVALAIEDVAMACVMGLGYVMRWRIGHGLFTLGLIVHASILATIGVALGPLFVTPVLIFGSLPLALTASVLRAPRTIFIVHFGAVFVPLALEWLHIVPSTYEIVGGALVLEPWAVTMTPTALLFSMISIVVLQLVGNTLALDSQRREQDLAQETVHLQRWQFSQLVKR